MARSKPGVKYQGFALAIPLIQEIKDHIKDDDQYRSVTDFVRQAVREKMNAAFTVESIEEKRKETWRQNYIKKYGVAPENDTTKRKYEIRGRDLDDGAPKLIDLEARINSIEEKMVTKEYIDKLIQELFESNKKKKDNNVNGHGLS